MKNDAKFEEEWTCQFEIDMRNLTKFDPSIQQSKNLNFNELLLTKVHVWAKKSTEEFCLITLKIDVKFEGNLTCTF